MTNLYMGGEDLPDDYVDENGAHYNVENQYKKIKECTKIIKITDKICLMKMR